VREASGLPWGCVVQPLSAQTRFAPGPAADALARCSQCYGYVHWLVRFDSRHQWPCSFCGHTNAAAAVPRYATPAARQAATELRAASYESIVAADGAGGAANQAGGWGVSRCVLTLGGRTCTAADGLHTPTELVYVLLVDLEGMQGGPTHTEPHSHGARPDQARATGSPAYLAQVKLALQAAMESRCSWCCWGVRGVVA
jgi:hypothetical protein